MRCSWICAGTSPPFGDPWGYVRNWNLAFSFLLKEPQGWQVWGKEVADEEVDMGKM